MYKHALRAIGLIVLASSVSAPAFAEDRVDVGPLHIRIAHHAPPRAVNESRAARPGPNYVWIKGYQDWQGDQWVWVKGHWVEQRPNNDRWVAARYMREGDAWRYEPAHWSSQTLVEDDDYKHWREEHHHNNGNNHNGHDEHHDNDGHDRHDGGH